MSVSGGGPKAWWPGRIAALVFQMVVLVVLFTVEDNTERYSGSWWLWTSATLMVWLLGMSALLLHVETVEQRRRNMRG